jgi:Ca-activated chloride channel family protein
MLTFLYPWMFAAVVLPLLVRWLVPARIESVSAVRVPFFSRLESAGATGGDNPSKQRSMALATIIWVLVLIALARPQWLEEPIERTIPTRDLLLLVDLSGSMDQKDFQDPTGQPIDRLQAVKGVLEDFLTKREGDRVGLVVFGNAPFLQVPFTTDLELCRQLLDETAVGMAGPRTALGDAIGLGIQLFDESDAPTKTMIALTDGNDTASSVPPVEAARVARDREITIHTIAIGDPETVGEEKLDQEALREVAATTEGGQFFLALDRDELAGIYDRLDQIETRDVQTVSHRPRTDLYFWPLGIAFLLSLLVHASKLVFDTAGSAANAPKARLRVNPTTFELETIDQ